MSRGSTDRWRDGRSGRARTRETDKAASPRRHDAFRTWDPVLTRRSPRHIPRRGAGNPECPSHAGCGSARRPAPRHGLPQSPTPRASPRRRPSCRAGGTRVCLPRPPARSPPTRHPNPEAEGCSPRRGYCRIDGRQGDASWSGAGGYTCRALSGPSPAAGRIPRICTGARPVA